MTRVIRQAKHSCKAAIREAKKRFKAEKKAAKHAFKAARKAHKDALKTTGKGRKSSCDAPTSQNEAMETDSVPMTFPVVVEDGRMLNISWNKGDDHQAVAVSFAAQHGIGDGELPTILHFLAHAEQHAQAVAKHAEQHAQACAKASSAEVLATGIMDVSNPTGSGPTESPSYVFQDEGQLAALDAMGFGFVDQEIKLQLLSAHKGNLDRVVEQLL